MEAGGERLAAISVDLDSIAHYCRVFGLADGQLDEAAQAVVWRAAIPRFLELFDALGSPGTFFVIASDLSSPGLVEALQGAHVSGVELASHSHAHDYALSRWPAAAIAADLARAHAAITDVTGVAPVGFRAPGYTLTPALLEAVVRQGYLYDSSAFPAAPYYLLKAGVMGALAALGRPSSAVLDSPRVLLAPREPYRPDPRNPYARARTGAPPLVELPISVSRLGRVPLIGQLVMLAPWPVVSATVDQLEGDALVNLELHAVDVLDASDGLPAALAARQRDLRVPAATKLERLRRLFSRLKTGRELVTLSEAARRLSPFV